MFGIVARIVSYSSRPPCCSPLKISVSVDGVLTHVVHCRSVAALLFPIFASYKALKANDQTQLTPWLMYWVVIACVIVVDNFFGWFLSVYTLHYLLLWD